MDIKEIFSDSDRFVVVDNPPLWTEVSAGSVLAFRSDRSVRLFDSYQDSVDFMAEIDPEYQFPVPPDFDEDFDGEFDGEYDYYEFGGEE